MKMSSEKHITDNTTLLKLQVDTIPSEYIETILTKTKLH